MPAMVQWKYIANKTRVAIITCKTFRDYFKSNLFIKTNNNMNKSHFKSISDLGISIYLIRLSTLSFIKDNYIFDLHYQKNRLWFAILMKSELNNKIFSTFTSPKITLSRTIFNVRLDPKWQILRPLPWAIVTEKPLAYPASVNTYALPSMQTLNE